MRINIDGTWEHDRCLVWIDGYPVPLTARSFKYLVKLAWELVHPTNESSPGWIYKSNIEKGENQARYLYRLKAEIKEAYPSDWEVVENNRMGYYRLIAVPGDITFTVNNLLKFPDYEVTQLFKTESQTVEMTGK